MAGPGRILSIGRTLLRLGPSRVAGVALYRLRERMGRLLPPPPGPLPEGPVFVSRNLPAPVRDDGTLSIAEALRRGELTIFGGPTVALGAPFDWYRDVLADYGVADIKGVWEASRFGWAPDLARAHRLRPDAGFIETLEAFTDDWLTRNPPWQGPNWTCGQETAMRALHLLQAHHLLAGSADVTPRLAAILAMHAARIEPSMGYAIAQDNNHATSEAAALYIIGSVLAGRAEFGNDARRWQRIGHARLEQAVDRLVFADGGFAQYSVNYHRLVIDTLVQAELWRRRLALPAFSPSLLARAGKMVEWLAALTNATTGAAPNLGANDGAQCYRFVARDYADQRTTITLGAALFDNCLPDVGADPDVLAWAGIDASTDRKPLFSKKTRLFPDFGLALLNPRADGRGTYGFLRYPRRRFRPSQADMLHFDLWSEDGRNLLHDAGSFSYAHPDGNRLFAGIAAHNSVMLDSADPMRRIGRFLFADWPDCDLVEGPTQQDGEVRFAAGYRDYRGYRHVRRVTGRDDAWTVVDECSGGFATATLRWHLSDTDAVRLSEDGGAFDIEPAERSPTYGVRLPALAASLSRPGPSCRFVTTIAAE